MLLLEIVVNKAHEFIFGEQSYLGSLDLPLMEKNQGGDASHTKPGWGCGIAVDIDFGDLQAILELCGDVLKDWGDGLAWAAPLGPEIHKDRKIRLDDVFLEGMIGYLGNAAHALKPHAGIEWCHYSPLKQKSVTKVMRFQGGGQGGFRARIGQKFFLR